MMKKSKWKIFLFGALTLIVIFFVFIPKGGREKHLINEGNILIEKIENFRKDNGRLPDKMEEIGYESLMGGINTLFYIKYSDLNYTISFGTTLGESIIYNSNTKQWKDGSKIISP